MGDTMTRREQERPDCPYCYTPWRKTVRWNRRRYLRAGATIATLFFVLGMLAAAALGPCCDKGCVHEDVPRLQ
jgi:hypothetical protein